MGRYDDNDEMELMGITVRWWWLLLTLSVATGFIFLAFKPTQEDMETRGQRRSLQYITSHQSALRALYSQYRDPTLSLPQHRAIFMQMQQEADLIPGQVPTGIQNELNRGPE